MLAVSHLFLVPIAGAHGLGTSFNQTVGNYFVEFEYDNAGNVAAGQYQNYNFDILDPNTKEFLDFERAFVRITKKGGSVVALGHQFATNFLGDKKSARLGTVLPEEGDYLVYVIFYGPNENKLVETTFDLRVVPAYNAPAEKRSGNYIWLAALVGGLVAGIGIHKGLLRKRGGSENP